MNDTLIMPACGPASGRLPSPASLPHRILVVDDDVHIRQLNTRVLVHSGYEVNAAEDGAAGWEALSADSYDLLITDHNMPGVTGVELIKKIHAARMALPVIMATGTFPEEEFNRYPWLQPAATLLKPFTADQLLAIVGKVLGASGGARALVESPPNGRRQSPSDDWRPPASWLRTQF